MRRLSLVLILCAAGTGQEWKRADGPLTTRWTDEVDPENVLPEYPRPQLVREEWLNLNGLWEFAVAKEGEPPPVGKTLPGKILVPFPVESALSGVMRRAERVWYRRTFTVPEAWKGRRVLLHFGAVDWEATVWLDGKKLGTHRGGYDAFAFPVAGAGRHELIVGVFDPTDGGPQPRGKQVKDPRGIWYTPTTGIWQTVWLEPVPSAYISRLEVRPDVDAQRVYVVAHGVGQGAVRAVVPGVGEATGGLAQTLEIRIPKPKLWSPADPHLYDLEVRLGEDIVKSYFGMRKIALGKRDGVTRILLNDEFLFQLGLLDQGFWPDGLYRAPTDEALRYDLEVTKKLGFNMIRKHVKIEPARWYYWCDKLGLLVWQDMPSGDKYARPGQVIERAPESALQFEIELRRLVEGFGNHPSIVMWMPFNEGWGQYQTDRIVRRVKQLDPTRLVCCASGWTDVKGVGDVHDIHRYPGPGSPRPEVTRAAVLGEFGGLGLPLKGHTWQAEKNWGYRSFETGPELNDAYLGLIDRLRFLVADPGLSAAVYTQTTDVEIEVNGVMTYDRRVTKLDAARVAAANRRLYGPPPRVRILVPVTQAWRFTIEEPKGDWFRPAFDDSGWKEGKGGFGTRGTPGARIGTEWKTNEIWIRRSFDLPAIGAGADVRLKMHHDEDAHVYVNGVLAAKTTRWTVDYGLFPLAPEAPRALRAGRNVIAIHCRQTGGGQFIDAGLVEIIEAR